MNSSILPLVILLLLSSSPAPAFTLQCDKNDAGILLKIKAAFGNPRSLSSWKPNTNCCDSWAGILCEIAAGQVLAVNVSDANDIAGPIPSIIGDLPVLSYIIFQNVPHLTGPLPTTLTKLTLLKTLNITGTALSDNVPSFLSTLPQLIELDLSHNNLSGEIPRAIASGPLIFTINFSHNRLSGRIPSELFKGFLTNPNIDFSHNMLTGQIPRELGKIAWTSINLSSNKLTGDASFLFGETKLTQAIDLSRNMLNFDLSKVKFPTVLVVLDLNHNTIRGRIPAQIVRVRGLKIFNVSYNRLCGRIPVGGPMKRFGQTTYVHNKCLCGKPLTPCM